MTVSLKTGIINLKKEKKKMSEYTYILKCSDGTYYTGYTNDLGRRITVHNKGKGAKYTRSRLPVELVYYEEYETKSEALSREYAIKQMTRDKKEDLIRGFPERRYDKEDREEREL